RRFEHVEIRKYPRMVVARVDGYGDSGFNFLFRFISGQNNQNLKVAMTAPVVSENIAMTAPVLSGESSIAFVMPKNYALESTPHPTDERVKIAEYPPGYVAALRFSGRWTRKAFERRSKEMLDELKRVGVATRSDIFFMRYNSPFSPWFMRRNEVAIVVAWQEEDELPERG
ncbi:MAG TPA: heme-binding protein, partial [Candidatus Bathyarchaeia archaeon]|nr:heme-binding protein [Candidatus Bathyarchaeia archaeon]